MSASKRSAEEFKERSAKRAKLAEEDAAEKKRKYEAAKAEVSRLKNEMDDAKEIAEEATLDAMAECEVFYGSIFSGEKQKSTRGGCFFNTPPDDKWEKVDNVKIDVVRSWQWSRLLIDSGKFTKDAYLISSRFGARSEITLYRNIRVIRTEPVIVSSDLFWD